MEAAKEILVFSRMHITNYGDPIIGDCCKYLIEKTAAECGIPVRVLLADIYEKDEEILKKCISGKQAVVFPGGGMNSVVFNRNLLKILALIEQHKDTKVFFHAVGINRISPNPKNEELLTRIFNSRQTAQITTRGDYAQLSEYITQPKAYPCRLVFDPAVWADEVYQVSRRAHAKKIGIGIIRPEIYEGNGNQVSVEDVFSMYIGIIRELERKGYRWELFTNGMKHDYLFGGELLNRLGRKKRRYMRQNVDSGPALVRRIAGYRGIIASRLHANILAVSLRIPSVGLVWNDKMNLFAEIIGEKQRFISGECLQDAPYIVGRLEEALQNGYQEVRIAAMKQASIQTIKNIVQ